MENKKINYQKLVEDWCEKEYGCLCCKKLNSCEGECHHEMDFNKLIYWINCSRCYELDRLKIEDYIIEDE